METLTQLLPQLDGQLVRSSLIVSSAVAAPAAVCLCLRWWRRFRRLPPGPSGLPLLGCRSLNDQTKWHTQMQELAGQYGGIFSFYFGTQLIVVVSDYDMMKEMLEAQEFAGRMRTPLVTKLTENCGIGIAEGAEHTYHRRLSLRILRDFGFAKNASVDMVETAMETVYCTLDAACETQEPVRLLGTLMQVSNSVIAQFVFGKCFTREDKDFAEFCDTLAKFFTASLLNELDKWPILYHLVMRLPVVAQAFEVIFKLRRFIDGIVAEREAAMTDESVEPACLCDVYVQEKRKAERNGDFQTFRAMQLQCVCTDFFLAGTDTTARSVEWLLIFMAFNPDVQRRVQQELDDVVGRSRTPKLSDKANLHFTNATIDEGYRRASLVVFGVYHRATCDADFRGFLIPKDTLIMPHSFTIHNNSRYWHQPRQFKPERFLDESGRYRSSSKLLPFHVGKRSCVGESLARVEIFAMFTLIMQRYSVRPADEFADKEDEIIEGEFRLTRQPKDYRLVFRRR